MLSHGAPGWCQQVLPATQRQPSLGCMGTCSNEALACKARFEGQACLALGRVGMQQPCRSAGSASCNAVGIEYLHMHRLLHGGRLQEVPGHCNAGKASPYDSIPARGCSCSVPAILDTPLACKLLHWLKGKHDVDSQQASCFDDKLFVLQVQDCGPGTDHE